METTLFRTDSMTTKAARGYMLVVGSNYLKGTLAPLIDEIAADPNGFEVCHIHDPCCKDPPPRRTSFPSFVEPCLLLDAELLCVFEYYEKIRGNN